MKFLPPEWHDKLPSTNTVLRERIRAGEDLLSGFVLAALEQTAGRGRYGRRWISRPGRDLTFSFLLHTHAEFPKLTSLSLAVAVGIASALETFGIRAQTKWSNDLLVDGRKICGILSEHCRLPHRPENTLVVGVGVNVNMQASEAAAIDKPATSISIQTGREVAVDAVLDRILDALPAWIDLWKQGGFPALREAWIGRCESQGKRVTVGEGRDRKTGIVTGFGSAGQLLLREDTGVMHEIWAGDVESEP